MTLPIDPGTHPRDLPLPKKLIVGLTICAAFGLVGAVAAVFGAVTGTAQQKDVLENQRISRDNQQILNAVCENARTLTEQFATAEPSPCPTVEP